MTVMSGDIDELQPLLPL